MYVGRFDFIITDITVDRSATYAEKGVTRADKDKIADVIKV